MFYGVYDLARCCHVLISFGVRLEPLEALIAIEAGRPAITLLGGLERRLKLPELSNR
jgi:hypothetical protein